MEPESEVAKRRRQLRQRKEALLSLQTKNNRASFRIPTVSAAQSARKPKPSVDAIETKDVNSIQQATKLNINIPPVPVAEDLQIQPLPPPHRDGERSELMGQVGYSFDLGLFSTAEHTNVEGNATIQNSHSPAHNRPLKYQFTLRDNASDMRPVTAVRFHHKFDNVVLTAHGCRTDDKPGHCQGTISVWEVGEDHGSLQRSLISDSAISAMALPSISPTLVIAGTEGGTILMWDTRVKTALPVNFFQNDKSPSPNFHGRQKITAVKTTSSASPYFVTTSAGGHICKWSLSKPDCPISKEIVHDASGTTELDIECLDFPRTTRLTGEERGRPNRGTCTFLGGMDGGVYRVHGSESVWNMDSGRGQHQAGVTSISAHPFGNRVSFLDDVIATTSRDWTIRIWHFRRGQACVPLMCFDMISNGVVNDVAWSGQHASVFCTADDAGVLSLFDVSGQLDGGQRRPWDFKVPDGCAQHALTSVQWSNNSSNVCAGDKAGRLSMWSCSSAFGGLPDAEWMEQYLKSKAVRDE